MVTPSLTVTPLVVQSRQWVPRPLEEAFAFFSDARNLERITPPWLSFHVASMSTPEIGEGTLIDYALKLHGIPMRWRSRIENWAPDSAFVDTQVQGPYAHWRHLHSFSTDGAGTLIEDRVDYRVPLGVLGNLVGGPFVRANLRRIFAFRQAKIAEILG